MHLSVDASTGVTQEERKESGFLLQSSPPLLLRYHDACLPLFEARSVSVICCLFTIPYLVVFVSCVGKEYRNSQCLRTSSLHLARERRHGGSIHNTTTTNSSYSENMQRVKRRVPSSTKQAGANLPLTQPTIRQPYSSSTRKKITHSVKHSSGAILLSRR